jgi:hypothetical protein
MFKIELFNALQTQVGPSKHNPHLKMKTMPLEVFKYNLLVKKTNKHTRALSLQVVKLMVDG